jgi:hypothetical protein
MLSELDVNPCCDGHVVQYNFPNATPQERLRSEQQQPSIRSADSSTSQATAAARSGGAVEKKNKTV